jgi:uncharacterized protein YaaR (DUF327 family)
VPYYDLTKTSGIIDYVLWLLSEYSKDNRNETEILDKLKVVFNKDSECQKKILNGSNCFLTVFTDRVDEKALNRLKYLLLKIDADSYGAMVGATEISIYVRDLIEEFNDNPDEKESETVKKLSLVFNDKAEIQRKVLKGNEFSKVFKQKVGKKRGPTLKQLLLKLPNAKRYANVDCEWK